jgi:hypothetical protein
MKYLLDRPSLLAPGPRAARSRPSTASPRGPASEKRGAHDKHSGERGGEGWTKSTQGKNSANDKRTTSEKKASGEKKAGAERKAGAEKKSASATGTGSRNAELFYRGQVPRRRLRLAEFLYYSGRISWQTLINAIVWQKMAKPKFGELARDLREISSQELAKILASKLRNEQTGQTALRLRLLTAREVQRILILQRARHRPIGRYFVEKSGLSADQLNLILRELYRHNARYGRLT